MLSGAHPFSLRKRLAENVQELVAGAVCGLLWTGEQDLDLVPRSLQPCGTPRNYFRINFDKTEYAFRFKGIGIDEAYQADVWIADGNPQDREIEELASLPTGSVVVNLFAGGPETQIRMRIDDGAWQPLEHKAMPAPTVLRSRLRNQQVTCNRNTHAAHPTAIYPRHISGQGDYPKVRRQDLIGCISKPVTRLRTEP